MKKFALGLALSFSALSAVHAAGTPPVGNAQAGAAKAAVCAACHGPDGNSLAPTFPKLAGQSEKYLFKQLQDIKANKTRQAPQMTAIVAGLSDQDMADLAAHFASKSMSNGAAKKELVTLGEQIFRAGIKEKGLPACTGCHSPSGQGNAPAGFPRLSGQHADYMVTQLKNFQTGARSNDGDARTMRDVAYKLTEQEMQAVASFASGLH